MSALVLALVAVAGAVDAIGFLHFRTFYVSFMSGNTTRVAIAVAEGDRALVVRGAAIIAAFVTGVVAGELMTSVPPRRRPATLVAEAGLLLLAAGAGAGFVASILLAVAMGMHNALVLRAGGIGVALTYVTGTLVHLGRGIAARLAGRPGTPVLPYAGWWLALSIGAGVGAVAMRWGEATALVALSTVLIILTIPARPRPEERRP